ncbi:MAG TPA: trypsin-like peptidase domain-containing protein [Gemmataceae bacterium]|jgi:serine protease Do
MRRGVIGIGVVLAAALATPADDARKVEQALQAVIARAEPAVACLLVYRPDHRGTGDAGRRPFDDDRQAVPDFYASGVVLDPQGLILTNYHVVREAAGPRRELDKVLIDVRLPGRKDAEGGDGPPRVGRATVHAADVKSDLAVLKLDPGRGWEGRLPVVPLGRGEELKKGSLVVSLGHPYAAGYRDGSPSASWGIVSNLRRRGPGSPTESERAKLPLANFATLIQTDVRLQLGTSGGALLDADGRLVGLTTAQAALTGVDAPGGFAIPMDAPVRRIVEVLLRGEEVEYAFLGISTRQGSDPEPGGGVMVQAVIPNSPAARAGLMPMDVITRINGRPIRDYDDLFLNLSTTLAGRPAELVVRSGRAGGLRTVDVPLVKAPVEIDSVRHRRRDEWGVAKTLPRSWYGLRVEYTSAKDATFIRPGVLVRDAADQAKAAGLVPYEDIITHVNDRPVNSPAEFRTAADEAVKRGDSLKLTVAGDTSRTVTLP